MKREKEKDEWKNAQEEWKKEKEAMKGEIAILNVSVASLCLEEDEISNNIKEAIKEELTKALTTCIEDKLEASKERWVEVVKKNIRITQQGGPHCIHHP